MVMTSQINTLTISEKGLTHLKNAEALRLAPYVDQAGWWTVGWGHKFTAAELLVPGITKRTISAAEALNYLVNDLKPAMRAVNTLVLVRLTQYQFDALVSFVFNVGITAFSHSTLLRKINTGDVLNAASEILRWNKVRDPKTHELKISNGLVMRRQREWQQFIGADFIKDRNNQGA